MRPKQNLLTLLITAALTINLVIPAQTGADDRLSEMFQEWGFYANATGPGAYTAQRYGFITGGSLNVRSKYKHLRLGSVTPPKINAGCGGIDLFFGGVNFINADEFVDMLKSIGQNALGYAFELGLEAVCPTCNSVIKHLQKVANRLNKFSADSCSFAKSIVNNMIPVGSLSEYTINTCVEQLKSLGIVQNDDEARKKCINDNAELGKIYDEVKSNAQGNQKPQGAEPGISMERALRHLTPEEKTFAISLLGTYALIGPGSNGEKPELKYYPPVITLKDLLYGNPDAEVYYTLAAADPSYTGLTNDEIGSMQKLDINSIPDNDIKNYFKDILDNGFWDKIKEQMYRVHDKIVNKQDLDPEEIEFVNATIIPVQNLLEATKNVPGLTENTINLVSGLVAVYMIEELINGYIREAVINADNQSQVNLKEFIDSVTQIKDDLHKQLLKEYRSFDAIFKSYELTAFFYKQFADRVGDNLSKAAGAVGKEGG